MEESEIPKMVLDPPQHGRQTRGDGSILCGMPTGWDQFTARMDGGAGTEPVSGTLRWD